MEFQLHHAPVFTVLEFHLNENEEVIAQPDSMVSITPGIEIMAAVGETRSGRHWTSGFKSMLGGESFFPSVFRAKRDGQALTLAPENYGDILPIQLDGAVPMYLSRGSYLAHIGDCQLDARYGGAKSFLAKTGLFLLHVTGTGTVFCHSYGAVIEKTLADGEQFLIDNRYVVAFSESVKYQLVKASKSMRDSLMSGEGLVNRYTGPGRVFYQTRVKPSSGFMAYVLNATT